MYATRKLVTAMVLALVAGTGGCAYSPDRKTAVAKAALVPQVCAIGSPSPKAIYGTIRVDYRRQLHGDDKILPEVGRNVVVEPSQDPGFACVTFPLGTGTDTILLRLPVTADDRIEGGFPVGEDSYEFVILVLPHLDSAQKRAVIGSFYYHDEDLSGDSGGVWGGGK